MAMQITPDGKVDRQVITPFHLKLFYRTGGFHRYSLPLSLQPSTSPVSLQEICTTTAETAPDSPLPPSPRQLSRSNPPLGTLD